MPSCVGTKAAIGGTPCRTATSIVKCRVEKHSQFERYDEGPTVSGQYHTLALCLLCEDPFKTYA